MMMRPFPLRRVGTHGEVVLGLAVALGACGRVSLGSLDSLDGEAGGGQNDAGTAGGMSSGGAGASGAGQVASGGMSSGLGAATGLGGAGGGSSGLGGLGGLGDAGTPSELDGGLGGGTSADAGTPNVDGGPGATPLPPSCRDADPQCGPEANRASCCESLPVTGGSFDLQWDITGNTVPVTLSSFRLDRFEVTVGRMREFIARYEEWRSQGQPEQGLGEHPRIAGSGWQLPRFSEGLPASAADFESRLSECGPTPFSTYAEGLTDEVPLNCASWFEAAAFCAWDGGRLPTWRELAYAAMGGAEQRLYPWGDEPVPRRDLALFGCVINTSSPVCTIADVAPVGLRPLGAGFFGHDDLAGSMSEWVLDVSAASDQGCTDCADLGPDESTRRWRHGSWLDRADDMKIGPFPALPPAERNYFIGLRCARDD